MIYFANPRLSGGEKILYMPQYAWPQEIRLRRAKSTKKSPIGQQMQSPSRSLAGGGHWGVDWGKPVVAVGLAAAGDGEKLFLQLAGDRAGAAFADLNVVYRTDRGDFDSGANEEHFVRDVQHF